MGVELEKISRLYPSSNVLKNQNFLLDTAVEEMSAGSYSIVHIASHGQFDRDFRKSFVLTYDDKLTMEHIEQSVGLRRFQEEPLELLVLSACQTAAGDDRAALGLAGAALQAGARSALATLWSVDDVATAELVSEFYEQLATNQSISKARALQQAQLALVRDGAHPAAVGTVPDDRKLAMNGRGDKRTDEMRMDVNNRIGMCGIVLAGLLLSATAHTQVTTDITSDGTLGTTVNPLGNTYNIAGGTRPGNGPTLFHSFGQFTVGAADIANFSDDSGGLLTNTIVGRVTGGDQSQIYGTLRTTEFAGASLFLLNPAGIMFSENAELDTNGSFAASTADYVVLDNGWRLDADGSAPVLTVAGPTRFGFIDAQIGTIGVVDVIAPLAVGQDQTLTLVGGQIDVTNSTLVADSGRINVAAVASAGEVSLGSGWTRKT